MIQRFLVLLGLVMALWVGTPAVTFAAFDPLDKVCEGEASSSPACQADGSNPVAGSEGVLIRVVRILSYVVVVASVIMVIIGALKYVLSNGDANATTSAKNTILYALIGIVVFMLAQTIIVFVINRT